MHGVLPLTKGHLSNKDITLPEGVSLLEGDYCTAFCQAGLLTLGRLPYKGFTQYQCTFCVFREKDFLQDRESVYQQQQEKEQQYNGLVKNLKDRVSLLCSESPQ